MVDLKDEIMSGVIRALTAMIQETLGNKTRLKYIDTVEVHVSSIVDFCFNV